MNPRSSRWIVVGTLLFLAVLAGTSWWEGASNQGTAVALPSGPAQFVPPQELAELAPLAMGGSSESGETAGAATGERTSALARPGQAVEQQPNAAAIQGRLVWADGGPAVGHVALFADGERSPAHWEGRRIPTPVPLRATLTDHAGRFEFSGLVPGSYGLQLEPHEDHRSWVSGVSASVSGGEPRVFVVGTRSTLLGRVLLPDGVPYGLQLFPLQVPPATLQSVAEGGAGRPRPAVVEVVQGGDHFEFNDLAPGRYELLLDAPGRPPTIYDRGVLLDTVELGPGEVRRVLLDGTAAALADLRVRVRLGGLPAAGCRVELGRQDESGGRRQLGATLDERGTAELRDLPPGTWAVCVQSSEDDPAGPWWSPRHTRVELAPGASEEVEIDLELATGTIRVETGAATLDRPAFMVLPSDDGHGVSHTFVLHQLSAHERVELTLPRGEYRVHFLGHVLSAGGDWVASEPLRISWPPEGECVLRPTASSSGGR
jgi:hypothetical protein